MAALVAKRGLALAGNVASVEAGELAEVVADRLVGGELQDGGERLAAVGEAGESGLQLAGPFAPLGLGGAAGERTVQLLADRVLRSRQAVHDESCLAAQG